MHSSCIAHWHSSNGFAVLFSPGFSVIGTYSAWLVRSVVLRVRVRAICSEICGLTFWLRWKFMFSLLLWSIHSQARKLKGCVKWAYLPVYINWAQHPQSRQSRQQRDIKRKRGSSNTAPQFSRLSIRQRKRGRLSFPDPDQRVGRDLSSLVTQGRPLQGAQRGESRGCVDTMVDFWFSAVMPCNLIVPLKGRARPDDALDTTSAFCSRFE